ncbi:MAG TPA: ROK family protein [Acetobacteraceae bacterium]|jgi:polyphosphate glucokinase|nr:ROK family protein [Acetobacteraceae bacterium]
MDQENIPGGPTGPLTLALDIGGTGLKAGVLSPGGVMTAGPAHVETPHPSTPDAVIAALVELARPLGWCQRISIGFPGVVRGGRVITAPNLGTEAWRDVKLPALLTERLGAPARMANDATVQGLGVISGHGLECVITLGTGMGFALFEDGRPGPHLELSQHPVRGRKTYDQYLGNAAVHAIGRKRWNRRVLKALGYIATLTNFDTLYIGGGNARHIVGELPKNVHIVSNQAGITGGIRLWDTKLDVIFAAA